MSYLRKRAWARANARQSSDAEAMVQHMMEAPRFEEGRRYAIGDRVKSGYGVTYEMTARGWVVDRSL